MTQEEAIKLIQDSDLNDASKTTWIARITQEGLTQDVLDGLKDAFQSEIDAGFNQLGIDITQTAEYKQKEADMIAQVQAVQAAYENKMAQHSKDLADLQADGSQALDLLMAEEVKANME